MIDEKKIYNYIKEQINPYGKPFTGTVYEFGLKIMDYIENMEKVGEWIPCSERLPEVPEGTDDDECPEFNVMIKGANRATTLRCAPDGTWFDEFGHVYPVIFWHPLPEPYNLGMAKKQTNADRIRAMSDEDLAMNMMCPNENGLGEIECDKSDNCNCYECLLKWLQSEVEVSDEQ